MLDDFMQIKDELGVSFFVAFSIIFPIVKWYISNNNKKIEGLRAEIKEHKRETKKEFDKIESDADRRSKRLFESMGKVNDELHKISLEISDKFLNLKAEIKVLQSKIENGKK